MGGWMIGRRATVWLGGRRLRLWFFFSCLSRARVAEMLGGPVLDLSILGSAVDEMADGCDALAIAESSVGAWGVSVDIMLIV